MDYATSAIGSAPVEPGVVNEGEVLDSYSVAEAIKKAWSKTGLGSDVVLGLSGRHVIGARRPDQVLPEGREDRRVEAHHVARRVDRGLHGAMDPCVNGRGQEKP